VVAAVAVAVLAVAGWPIYQNVRAVWPDDGLAGVLAQWSEPAARRSRPGSSAPQSQGQDDDGPRWSHSRLAVVGGGREAGNHPVVVLGRPTGVTQVGQLQGVQKGLLAREIVRQAVLLAARRAGPGDARRGARR
jgi:hypothetical protein